MITRLLVISVVLSRLALAQIYTGPQPQVYAPSRLLRKIGIDQHMGAQLPLDVPFDDEAGKEVTLRTFTGKPIILALVYYQCPSLCNMVLNGVLRSAKELEMTAGDQYQIVAISFDPHETSRIAASKKQNYIAQYARSRAERGWHFLTGPEISSKAVADAAGFHYVYDSLTNQYAHSSAIMILTPSGRVARYFYGIDYPAHDLRLALTDATHEQVASLTDQVLLYCFHYDPATGKYAPIVMNLLRVTGVGVLTLLAGFLILMFRRETRGNRLRQGVAR